MRGRLLPLTLLVLLAAAVMVGLGFWQLGRLTERRAANALIAQRRAEPAVAITERNAAALDAETLAERRVTVSGTWDYEREVVVRGRAHQGAPGYHLLTPLRIDGVDRAVLVDRGFIPYTAAGPEQRPAFRKDARGQIEGLARLPRSSGEAAPGAAPVSGGFAEVWPRADLVSIGRQLPYPLLPVWVEQMPTPGNTDFPRSDPDLALSDGPHLGYMLQWWGFAAILLAGYFLLTTQPNAERGARNAEQRRA